jgi:FAD/FMN-containing dehydrogenase
MPNPTPTGAAALIDALRASLRGTVIDREHPAYERARRVWNGLIDRRPTVIARCADAADVAACVRLAGEHRPPVSIRGGGHQVAGSAVCDDGLVIDLSAVRGVEVDAERRVARVQGGATWGDVDTATQQHGLCTPGGEVSTTGVAGFTLGGGMALTMRRYGLACDNLRSIEIVTADGEVRTARAGEHDDLFWAARGAGRGIGVVTGFEFELHALGPDVAVVTAFHAYERAGEILRAWDELAHAVPETVTPQLILWSVPPDPTIPDDLHGLKAVVVGRAAADAAVADRAAHARRSGGARRQGRERLRSSRRPLQPQHRCRLDRPFARSGGGGLGARHVGGDATPRQRRRVRQLRRAGRRTGG